MSIKVARVSGGNIDESHANAKLIADAPLLAEQNEKMLARLKVHCLRCDGEPECFADGCETRNLIAEVEKTR
jgi:hypothetical protein